MAATVVLVLAVVDLRTVVADAPPAAAAPDPEAASAGTRGEDTEQQVAVTVVFKGSGPFVATIADGDGKRRTIRSEGEDVDVTRVFQGAGPYLFASAQLQVDGTIACRIEVDGSRTTSNKASGIYAQTVCAG